MRGSTNRSPCEAVQSERATRSEARLSTSKNRQALVRPAAASIRGKRRSEAGIHFASLAARGRLPRRLRNVRTQLYEFETEVFNATFGTSNRLKGEEIQE
jgi:hypothetical protein